jgi:hypothetical protein
MRIRMYLFLAIVVMNAFAGAFTTMIMPETDRLFRLMISGGDGLVVLMALTVLWRNRDFYGVKYFVAFLIASTFTFIYNVSAMGVLAVLNGMREPLFFFCALVIVYDLYQSLHRDLFLRYFTFFIVVFALAQIPLSLVQFFQYGAGDKVGGTYGTGGGSGLVTQLLFLIAMFLITRFGSLEHGAHFSVTRVLTYSVLLIPCALNETKISFFFLAAFLALIMLSRRKAYKIVPFLIIGGVLMYLLNFYYLETVHDTKDTADILNLDAMEKYLLTNPTDRGGDLPRFERLIIMFRILGDNPMSVLFGMGYGLFGGGNILGVSQVGRSLSYLSGSRILAFSVWIQGGLAAVLIFAGAMFTYLRTQASPYHTLKRFRYFLAFSLLAMWFYNEAVLDRTFASIVTVLMIWAYCGGDAYEEPELSESPARLEEPELSHA